MRERMFLAPLLSLALVSSADGAFASDRRRIGRCSPVPGKPSFGPLVEPVRTLPPASARSGPPSATASLRRTMTADPKAATTAVEGPALSSDDDAIVTCDQIVEYASRTGVNLTLSVLGPAYRAIARAGHNSSQVLGYCSGFVRPVGSLLHVDTMEVFKPAIKVAREENADFTNGGTVFGVGFLIGLLCFRHGIDNGCEMAEFLAIDDGEKQHNRLVRHYKRMGLNVIRYVGNDITDIPDRMVWGGVGTLMNAETKPLLRRWTQKFFSDMDR